MIRTLAARALVGVAGVEVFLTLLFSSTVDANQMPRPIHPAPRIPMTATPHRHRLANGASCNGGSEGSYAFDNGTTFTTNNVTTFGESNHAGAESSGVFEGTYNSVCDSSSAIGGGYYNVLDSGSGKTPSGADNSFIGAGVANSLASEAAFDGAGYENSVSGAYAFNGAGQGNQTSGEASATIAGYYNVVSNADSLVGAGQFNNVSSYESFIGAGYDNLVSNSDAFVGAGRLNTASGEGSFVGAGGTLTTAAYSSVVSGSDSFIGAGDQNTVTTNDAFIGSGVLNSVTSAANDSVIVGGYQNAMSGQKAALGGGEQNEVSGSFATIPGGYRDEALGNESFAAGSQAEARYTGSFVWSDYVSSEKPVADSRAGEFVARASGGVYFFSNAASSTGVHLAAGSGTWSSLSDRNAKTDIVPLDGDSILAKIASLPISAWQYKTERGVRHVGPMAQDFYAAFGVGEDDRHITSIDEDGVALAAIQALQRENVRLHDESVRLHDDNLQMHGENARLESTMTKIEARDADLARRFDALLTRDARRR